MSCYVTIQLNGTTLSADAETSYHTPRTCEFAWSVYDNPAGRWHLHPTHSKESIPDSYRPVPAKATGQSWLRGADKGDHGSITVAVKFYNADGTLADESTATRSFDM